MDYSISNAGAPVINVLGAGALGSIYGALLSEAGCEVTLIDLNKEHVRAINESGLIVRFGDSGKVYKHLRAVEHFKDAPGPDLVLLLVKSLDTEKAISGLAEYIPPSCTLLTLQNGLGNTAVIKKYFPHQQVLSGISYNSGTLLGPGEVLFGGRGLTLLGESDGTISPRVEAIKRFLDKAGLPAVISENIRGQIWTKVLVSVGINPLAALTRLTNGELATFSEGRELVSGLVAEAATLAAAMGIRLETEDPVGHVLEFARGAGRNRSSMLQDVLRRRYTEIDSINGSIVRYADELGLQVPLNLAVTRLIKLLERSELE